MINEQARRRNFRSHVGQLELNGLEIGDGLAKLLALLGVFHGGIESALRHPQAQRGDREAAASLASAPSVPGRFEPVDEGQRFSVLVDYAHTPDSIENVLRAARSLGDGRLTVVFGAGGDRDREKRPLMGKIGAELADRAIVTTDTPRSEEPGAIAAEVAAGATGADIQRLKPSDQTHRICLRRSKCRRTSAT